MRNWNAQIARQQMARLLAPGILGFYTHVEITEIFATAAGRDKPVNVFTIFVAEERAGDAAAAPVYVTPKPLRVPLLKGWTFGIKRTIRPIGELVPLFDAYCATMEWRPSNENLEIGSLVSLPSQFVPPDSTGTVPWNRALKNISGTDRTSLNGPIRRRHFSSRCSTSPWRCKTFRRLSRRMSPFK
jgi:hypothetical protein